MSDQDRRRELYEAILGGFSVEELQTLVDSGTYLGNAIDDVGSAIAAAEYWKANSGLPPANTGE